MTGSMLSAMILSDLIQEKNNEYSTVFSPSRNMLKPQLISNLGHALVGIGRVGGKDAVIWDVSFSGIKKNRHGNVHVMAQDFQQMGRCWITQPVMD